MTSRRCGSCEACCHVLRVVELEKPAWTRCSHQTGHGCAVYEDAPCGPAKGFECLWLKGHMALADRPDRIGVIYWTGPLHPELGKVVRANETADGCAMKGRGRVCTERYATSAPVIASSPGGTTRYLSNRKEDLAAIQRVAQGLTRG